jgi:DNA processing protein
VTDPAWVALSLCKHLGGKTFDALLNHFDHNLYAILYADAEELRQVKGVGKKIAQAIESVDLEQTRLDIRRWKSDGVEIIPYNDERYPARLRHLDDYPPTLFVRGAIPDGSQHKTFAIVGTRAPAPESCEIAELISVQLAARGHLIVSGLAFGVDSIAHRGALSVAQGKTAAVLGSGVLNIYPPKHHELAQAIMARGAIISEVKPDSAVSAPGLVARNRIIAGLSDSVIIIQTELDGGAMHTTRFARQQGKPIYVVDHPASGNQQLLLDGAIVISRDLRELFK